MSTHPQVPRQRRTFVNRFTLTFNLLACSMLVLSGLGIDQSLPSSRMFLAADPGHALSTSAPPKVMNGYGKLPLSFEANQGQTNAPVRFLARGRGYALFLTGDGGVLSLRKPGVEQGGAAATRGVGSKSAGPGQNAVRPYNRRNPLSAETGIHGAAGQPSLFGPGALPRPLLPVNPDAKGLADLQGKTPQDPGATALRMRLVGANVRAAAAGADELPGKVNYFIGNDPKKWRTNVPTYARVKYQGVYPGIDLVYYGNQGGQLEYGFVVAPGADPSAIKLDVGAVREPPSVAAVSDRRSAVGTLPLQITADGDLIVPTGDGEVRFHKPVVYQLAVSGVQGPKSEAGNESRNS